MKHVGTITLLFFLIFSLCSCNTQHQATAPEAKPEKQEELQPLSKQEMKIMKLMGGSLTKEQNIQFDDIVIHRREKEISFPSSVNMISGELEIVLCTPKGRAHESLLMCHIDPFKLQLALILLGAKNGSLFPNGNVPQGSIIDIDVQPENGPRESVENWILKAQTKEPMKRTGFVFVGSSFSSDGVCLAERDGNVVDMNSQDLNTILHLAINEKNKHDYYECRTEKIPKHHAKDPKKPDELWATEVMVFLKIRKGDGNK
jgi:hypothetical protein